MNVETKETISNKTYYVRYALHMLLTLLVAVGVAWFSNEIILEDAWNERYFLFSGIILAVILVYGLLEKKRLYDSFRGLWIQIACFVISALLLLLSDYYVNFPVWVLGGVVAAALIDRNIGMLYMYYFVYHAIYLQGNQMNALVFHFVLATLICLVIPKMKTFLSMFYMMAFAACTIIAGSVLHNRMSIDEGMMLDTFYILCTYLVCILITMLLIKWTGGKTSEKQPEEEQTQSTYEYLERLAEETAKQDAALLAISKEKESLLAKEEPLTEEQETEKQETEEQEEQEAEVQKTEVQVIEEQDTTEPEVIDYSPYCNEKSELLLELRAKNKSAHAQAILVGKLAAETAASIGLDADLTKAGGLYKRIGKIKEENDDSTSVEIAKEHNFPEPLVSLLDQLNNNRIEQKEAALLLITDGVISYYSIVRHVQKTDISVEKIVDSIVSKKIFQGEFNESGLSMQECFLLREKLIDLLKNQDKKHAAK